MGVRMTRKQFARNRFTRENLNGNADGNQTARKHSDKGLLDMDPSERKAALLSLPLQTHVDMVTLTLDNLEMKLGAIGALNETQYEMSVADVELLLRLSERLLQQRERIERMCGELVVRVN